MATYRLKVWTGPVGVVEWGRKLRRAGLRVPTTGTEHVYVDVEASKQHGCAGATHNMRAALMRKYKKDWGFKPESCQLRAKRQR
jgi:hypothetical protein